MMKAVNARSSMTGRLVGCCAIIRESQVPLRAPCHNCAEALFFKSDYKIPRDLGMRVSSLCFSSSSF